MAYAQVGKTESERYQLLLAGGAVRVCSSMAARNCTEKPFSEDDKSHLVYKVVPENIKKFANTRGYRQLQNSISRQFNAGLVNIHANYQGRIMTRTELVEALEDEQLGDAFSALPDSAYYALLDSMEAQQLTVDGKRKQERVAIEQSNNTASVAVYQAFVDQARLRLSDPTQSPKIAVVTASSRDPFEAADFYRSVFEQFGAEVLWLPLDRSYLEALEWQRTGMPGCRHLSKIRASHNIYYREQLYPEYSKLQTEYCLRPAKLRQQLAAVQGVFFNGGDQSLTLAALKLADGSDSPALALIRQRMAQGHLIVGGTSAGTAVQAGGSFANRPVPMLTNGHSENAMSRGAFANLPPSERCLASQDCSGGIQSGDLTYNAAGGTGLFHLGLLDTHFSERDRETRLTVFTAEAGQRFGFGVDETTAMLVAEDSKLQQTRVQVIGQKGVFILDHRLGHYSRSNLDTGKANVNVSGIAHYIATGGKAVFDHQQGEWQFQLAGERLSQRQKLKATEDGTWRDMTKQWCGSDDVIVWQQFGNQYRMKASPATEFYSDIDAGHCSYARLPFVISFTTP